MVTIKDMLDTLEHIGRIRACLTRTTVDTALCNMEDAIAKRLDEVAADLPAYLHKAAAEEAQLGYMAARLQRARDIAKATGIPGT